MTSILLRAPKSPFVPATVERTLAENLIGNNSGNLVFIGAAWKLLSTRGAEITAAGLGGYPARAAEFSERHDVYVAPLADAFRLGWEASLERLTTFIEQLTIPVVILGVGAQGGIDFSAERLKPIEPIVKRFVRAVLDRGPTIGVRGERTAAYLEGLGFSDVEVIGCPSMFMHGDRLEVSKRVPDLGRDSRLAINIGHSRGYSHVAEMRAFIRPPRAAVSAPDPLRPGPLDPRGPRERRDRPDRRCGSRQMPLEESHPLLQPRTGALLHRAVAVDQRTCAEFDFSFGTRIHGNIAALIAGTPAFVLAPDSRTLELARYFEIPHRASAGSRPRNRCGRPVRRRRLRAAHGRSRGTLGAFRRATSNSHGLHHTFADGEDAAAFDRRIARIRYPTAISAPGAMGRLRARRGMQAIRHGGSPGEGVPGGSGERAQNPWRCRRARTGAERRPVSRPLQRQPGRVG